MHCFKPLMVSIVLSLVSAAAMAQTPMLEPLQVELRYDGSIAGLPLGRIRVTIHETATDYQIRLDTKARGVASLFSAMRSVAEARGLCAVPSRYTPQFYESTEEKNGDKRWREARITYDAKGTIIERFRKPMDDPKWRPVVPMAEANTAVDPISAYLVLRPKLQHILAADIADTEVRTYDGARLAVMHFHVVGRTTREIMGKPMPVVDTTITRHIIRGYTPKEEKKFKEGDPEIHIYFSDDARLLPVLVTVDLGVLGEMQIVLGEIKIGSS